MVKIQNWVSESEVVKVLNVDPPSPSSYAQFVEAYWTAANPDAPPHVVAKVLALLREWAERGVKNDGGTFTRNPLAHSPYFKPHATTVGQGWRLPDTIPRAKSRSIGAALVSAHLRTLVDDWLDTGRDPTGAESPSQRSIHKRNRVADAVSEFMVQCPASWHPSSDPSGFQLILASRTSAGPQAADFFEAAQFEANRLFGGIIASDWSQCLCKCRYRPCGRYFIRAKLRRAYRHGTFCSPEHRNHASAVAVFTAQRSRAKLSLIELAAKWLVQQDRSSAWQGKVDSRRRLAAFLSMRVGQDRNLQSGRESVQLNWVTRNRAAIEKRRLELI